MRLRTLLLLLLAGTSGFYAEHWQQERTVYAASSSARCQFAVPRDWGDFKGASQWGFAFEDSNGTIRVFSQLPCSVGQPHLTVEMKRE